MKNKTIAIYLGILLFAGCVPVSLHELYTDQTLTLNPDLVGTWVKDQNADTSENWQFSVRDDKSYNLVISEKTGDDTDKKILQSKLIVHLFRIDKKLFMDLYPDDMEMTPGPSWQLHLVRAHTFLMVDNLGKTLEMKVMDLKKLKEMLEKDPKLVKHEIADERVVLTASPAELQKFIREHCDDEDLFEKLDPFVKQQPQKQTPPAEEKTPAKEADPQTK